MNYRLLGKTRLNVSEIGLGTEYLISQPKEVIVEVVKKAINSGINYIDLLYVTPEYRDAFGIALNGIRDKVIIAGHIGLAHIDGQYNRTRDKKIAFQLFEDLLFRLKTDYIDIVMLHYVDSENIDEFEIDNLYGIASEIKNKGHAKFMGVSSHKIAPAIKAIDSGKIDVLMFPINITKQNNIELTRLLNKCKENEIGLVAMKPFGGGKLLWSVENATPVQCLNYILSYPEVSTIVPGVKNVNELNESLKYFISTDETKSYGHILEKIAKNQIEECLFCNHCLPCPAGINIGESISLLAIIKQYGVSDEVLFSYNELTSKPSSCISCGACLNRCFLDINIILKLKELVSYIENEKTSDY